MAKRISRRSTAFAKRNTSKTISKTELSVNDREDDQDIVMRELLHTLLSLCTTECNIHKNFAKLKFLNWNRYSGWLGVQGYQGVGKFDSNRGTFDCSLTTNSGKFMGKCGEMYEGEVLGGRRHGRGFYKTIRYQYSGSFKNGAFHGEGVLNSKKYKQKGVFGDGILLSGEVHESAGVFKGIFEKSGLRKFGTYTFKNGDTYKGHWKADLFCGHGIYNWVDETKTNTLTETKYTGYWLDGKHHSVGMLAACDRVIICQWLEGKRSGAGVVLSSNGNCYAGIGLFENNTYRQGFQIRPCTESKDILKHIVKLTDESLMYDMEGRSDVLMKLVSRLVADYGDLPSPINPIRIPDYELGNVIPDVCNSEFEACCLQKVLSENYNKFRQLYGDYIHPGDECMNTLSVNLLYMDVFQSVTDVNVFECMTNSSNTISNLIMSPKHATPLSPIPFYHFFQHIVCITKVLMQNEELRLSVDKLKPTYFGTMAMQVIVVLKMLISRPKPKFLVREALFVCRTGVISLIQSIEGKSLGDRTVRAAYRFLEGKKMNFIQAVEAYYENFLKETESPMSNLELVEIVLYTSQLNLEESQKTMMMLRKRQVI